MIRYNVTPQGTVEWTVIRQGNTVAEGIANRIEEARIRSELAVLEAFEAEKISTVVLSGSGTNQLSLMKTTK